MTTTRDLRSELAQINATAEFNRWAGIEVTAASEGEVELRLPWRPELGQYVGFLHAGLVAAMIDTACGFAAATLVGPNVLASHFAVNCMSPAVGDTFIARATVDKAGKRLLFCSAELFAEKAGTRKLVASGETILMTAEP